MGTTRDGDGDVGGEGAGLRRLARERSEGGGGDNEDHRILSFRHDQRAVKALVEDEGHRHDGWNVMDGPRGPENEEGKDLPEVQRQGSTDDEEATEKQGETGT